MLRLVSFFCVVLATAFSVVAGTAGAANVRPPAHTGANRPSVPPPKVGWPQMMRDASHSSDSPDLVIDGQSAPHLGINWMSALRSADLGSPVSAYNTTLHKTITYVGDERGDVTAFDESNGTTLWSRSVGFGDSMRATPLVAPDGSVWVATAYSATLYKLDGLTGATDCSVKEAIRFNASPMFATPPGGVPTIFISTNDAGTVSGVTVAIRESDCSTIWKFNQFVTYAGAWATAAYGVDVNGVPLIIVGTADPDSTEYAINALTGQRVWYFVPANPPPNTYDIGAGATVSAPGVNGFADGVAYFPSKYGIMYALNLRTGAEIWEYNFNKNAHVVDGGRSSAALLGKSLVFGMANGVYALDATTGKKLWNYIDPAKQEVISSPAILGAPNRAVVGFGDVTGAVHFLRLSDGKDLYDYQTANYITSSPAVINGHFIIDSSDGFLYDFAVGGGNVKQGTTAITSPATGSSVPNPHGNLTVSGTAADSAGVTELQVSVQAGGPTGPWYDAGTGTWVGGVVNNFVGVNSPNKPSTAWSFQFPVPASGSTYQVFANTVDLQGQVDRVGAQSSFAVMPDPSQPQLKLSVAFAPPASSFTVTGSGFGPNEKVSFTLQGLSVGDGKSDSQGNVPSTPIHIPGQVGFGPSALVATGAASGKTTTGPVDLTNVWTSSGYNAAHDGYEPHDDILTKTLQATKKGYVARAWLFSTGAPVNSSPAIVAGSAYVGNDAGQFYAIDTASGAPFWTYATATGKPIHGSPSVDGSIVTFGADDGYIYTLAKATGNFVGKTQLDGIPTAPVAVRGSIYVASDAGTVFDIDEATGNVNWQTALGTAIHGAPSLDLGAGIVVVGDDGGTVTTLDSATGKVLRTATTGGAITASPAISARNIYVGSADGTFYVFNEKTDAPGWKYNAGSPIHAIAVTGQNVYVGSDNGSLAYFDQASGKKLYGLSFGKSPVVGIGATVGVPFVETADGAIGAIKNDQRRVLYNYQTSGTLSTIPAIVDGAVYVGAQDGSLYAFTSYGRAPIDSKEQRLLAGLRKNSPAPARWNARLVAAPALLGRGFEPSGPRDFALRVDRVAAGGAFGSRAQRGPIQRNPRSYVIYWAPGRSANAAELATVAAALHGGALPAGTALERSPYPSRIDDAVVQREIARQVALNRWNVDLNAQVFVVAGSALSASQTGYCAYRSAFDMSGDLTAPLPYAFVPHPDAGSRCGSLATMVTREQAEMRLEPLPH